MRIPGFLVLAFSSLSFFPGLADGHEIPPVVEHYYQGYNLVYAFSTAGERMHMSSLQQSRLWQRDERLQQIAARMAELDHFVLQVDPKIDPAAGTGNNYTGIYTIAAVTPDDTDGMVVEVLVYQLSREQNIHLIRRYDQLKQAPERIFQENVNELRYSHREFHRWKQLGGIWYKTEVNQVLTRA
jgi:hypothetical protein